MKIRLGVDIACRAPHHAACADESGAVLWSGQRFRTDVAELEGLWARLPADVDEVMVVMELTRNAWVPLAAWFRRQGAVVLVPSEQSADLRDYLAKHTKTHRLDAELLARLPVLHPEGVRCPPQCRKRRRVRPDAAERLVATHPNHVGPSTSSSTRPPITGG